LKSLAPARWDGSVALTLPHAEIAELDPLAATQVLGRLPAMNKARDVPALVRSLRGLLPGVKHLQHWNALAAMRDLGFLLGSLKRHDGVEPLELLPELESLLLRLGGAVDMPPRDTLLHFSVWNPGAPRTRTYTGLPDELALIESTRMAYTAVEHAISWLERLYETPLGAPEFVSLCSPVRAGLQRLVDAIIHSHRFVSPTVFAQELRLFFEPVHIGGELYLGPGAVELPLFVLDFILWGTRSAGSSTQATFREGLLPYVLPRMRACFRRYEGRPSLVERVLEEASTRPVGGAPERVAQGLEELHALLGLLVRFRAPHRSIASRAYSATSQNERTNGSGGYDSRLLDEILSLTRNAQTHVGACLQQHSFLKADHP
jgi:hypothetical protein